MPSYSTPEEPTVDSWRKAHAALLAEEKTLSEMAIKLADGTGSEAAMEAQRNTVAGLRELTEVVLDTLIKQSARVVRAQNAHKRKPSATS